MLSTPSVTVPQMFPNALPPQAATLQLNQDNLVAVTFDTSGYFQATQISVPIFFQTGESPPFFLHVQKAPFIILREGESNLSFVIPAGSLPITRVFLRHSSSFSLSTTNSFLNRPESLSSIMNFNNLQMKELLQQGVENRLRSFNDTGNLPINSLSRFFNATAITLHVRPNPDFLAAGSNLANFNLTAHPFQIHPVATQLTWNTAPIQQSLMRINSFFQQMAPFIVAPNLQVNRDLLLVFAGLQSASEEASDSHPPVSRTIRFTPTYPPQY